MTQLTDAEIEDVVRLNVIASCASCAKWNAGHGYRRGQCRNRSPHITFVKGSHEPMRTVWPLTEAEDFCGEHSTINRDEIEG